MKFINSLFLRKSTKGLTMTYQKKDNTWYVTKSGSILYIGEKSMCENYMSNVCMAENWAVTILIKLFLS